MTRKQRMYPESNRVKMSLVQPNLVDDIVKHTKRSFDWKDGHRVYDDKRVNRIQGKFEGNSLQNYLPDLSGQLGIPYLEDMRIQNLIDSDCCTGYCAVSSLNEEGAAAQPENPLGSGPGSDGAPGEREGQAKQSEARTTSVLARSSDLGEMPGCLPPLNSVLDVTDEDGFDYRNYGTGSQY